MIQQKFTIIAGLKGVVFMVFSFISHDLCHLQCFLPESTLYLTHDSLQKFMMPIHGKDKKPISSDYQDKIIVIFILGEKS